MTQCRFKKFNLFRILTIYKWKFSKWRFEKRDMVILDIILPSTWHLPPLVGWIALWRMRISLQPRVQSFNGRMQSIQLNPSKPVWKIIKRFMLTTLGGNQKKIPASKKNELQPHVMILENVFHSRQFETRELMRKKHPWLKHGEKLLVMTKFVNSVSSKNNKE